MIHTVNLHRLAWSTNMKIDYVNSKVNKTAPNNPPSTYHIAQLTSVRFS